MSIPVIQGNQGKLNKDNEPAYVTQGDYLDAENVRYFTTDGQTDGSHENVVGNSFAFNMGDVAPSVKGYKVCFTSPGAQTNTGWNYFGTPFSQSISSQQSYDPHIIEDTQVPGNLWMSIGYNIWYYDSTLFTWTEMTSMVVDSGTTFKSVRLTQSSTGDLACIYVKDFGSGDRYAIRKWNPALVQWDWLVNASTGFELADGYTNGLTPVNPYGAYYDPQIKYSSSGKLYIFVIGVHYDLTLPATNPYRYGLWIPKVFIYNTISLKWDYLSGSATPWLNTSYQDAWGLFTNNANRVQATTGNIYEISGTLYFPVISFVNRPSNSDHFYDPGICLYVESINGWYVNMFTTTGDWISSPINRRVFVAGLPISSNNITSWAESTLYKSPSGDLYFCFAVRTNYAYGTSRGIFFIYKNSVSIPTAPWTRIMDYFSYSLSPVFINSTYLDGKMSMVIDSLNNIILSFNDQSVGGKLCVVKYDQALNTFTLLDSSSISWFPIISKEHDLLLTSTGDLFVSYSDYAYAAGAPNYVGFASVQKYFGGGATPSQDITFTYSNGVLVGTVTAPASFGDIITGLNSFFPSPQYNVTTNLVTNPNGSQCLEFYINPIDNFGLPLLGGFNYYVISSGTRFNITSISDPIPAAESGALNVIGSRNVLNDLFIISTPNNNPVESLNIYEVRSFYVDPNFGLVLLIDKGSDIVDNGVVSLSNDISSLDYSGGHVCRFDDTSSFSFDYVFLVGYFPTPSAPVPQTLFVKSISYGCGEIGVAIKDENLSEQLPPASPWTYTRLIRHYALGLSTLKQADMIAEINNRGVSMYWVDDYNIPRSFYYYGPYIQDGGWNNINPLNIYTRSSILDQIKLQKSYGGAIIDYVGQGVGRLFCGNYRYSIRFTTSENVSTSWTPLTNPFAVYPVQADPYRIYGGDENEVSGKSNIINISWSQVDSYEYIEIGYTRSLPGGGSSPSSLFSLEQISVARIRLPQGSTSIQYEHTGNEINVNNIPEGQLGSIPFIIKRAKNIRSLDNRLVLSNVKVSNQESYLQGIFDSFTYTLKKKAIPICGTYSPTDLRKPIGASTNDYIFSNNKSMSFGEYQDPRNIFYFTGYMQNETYRFYAVAEFLGGEFSDAYFLFDVKFDRNGATPTDPKRNSGLSNFNLNDPTGSTLATSGAAVNGSVYIPYLEVNMPATLPSINGSPASSIIRRIHIYRENVENRTILATGLGILGNNAGPDAPPFASNIGVVWAGRVGQAGSSEICLIWGEPYGTTPYSIGGGNITLTSSPTLKYAPTPVFIPELLNTTFQTAPNQQRRANATSWYDFPVQTALTLSQIGSITSPDHRREMITFYSPDFSLTDYRIESPSTSSDFMLNYGHYDNYFSSHESSSSYKNYHSFGSYYVNRHNGDPQILSLNTTVTDGPVYWVGEGGQQKINYPSVYTGYKTYTKKFGWLSSGGGNNFFRSAVYMPEGYLFFTQTGATNLGVNTGAPIQQKDFGTYYMAYGRSITPDQQYGDSNIGKPVPTGAYYDLQTDTTQLGAPSSINTIDVFGGDTFTCKSLLKIRYFPTANVSGGSQIYGAGVEYYGQFFVNPYLRHNPNPATSSSTAGYIWPNEATDPTDSPATMREWFQNGTEDITYNASYSDKNLVNASSVYNRDLYYDSKLPATIFYSEPKLQESLTDSYSYIKATNRKDLDINDGPINHHEIFNGNLITFQERAVQQQYFNTTALFANATAQIVMGDGGAVMSRRGLTLSAYGLINKWSVVKGRSMGGDDVLYWFDAINKRILRFGADGVVPISTRASIDSFLANNTNYIQLYDTPANDMGVHGIWDESNREVIWTFRARKSGIDYSLLYGVNTGYNIGDTVYYDQDIANENYEWHQTGEFYVAQDNLLVGPPSEVPPSPNRPPLWLHIPHSDNRYYNEFTICYSEEKNGFTTFYSFKPKIYLQYKDRYLSPRPIAQQSFLYEHNFGARCIWYTGVNHFDPINDATALKKEAFIEGVINYNPEMVKTAEALSIDAYLDPNITSGIHRVEVRTKDHNTFMSGLDFNYAETMFRSPIKNDTQGGTVSPDSDTSRPYGRWISMKFVMDWGYLQSIRSFVMKLRERSRMYNR